MGVTTDVLHAVDQGVACHVVANVFIEIMGLNLWGANQDENLRGLEKDILEWQKAQGETCRLQGKLTFARIRTSAEWPKLKAKAAITRHLIDYAVHLCRAHDSGSDHDRLRSAVCDRLQRFYIILEKEGRYLSEAAKRELPELAVTFMRAYEKLSLEALRDNVRAWKLLPKFHMFQHICEKQSLELGNPRFYWVYSDEDLQKQMKTIALTLHPRTVQYAILLKWLILIFDD